jgi:hypothetical protein
VIVSLLYKVTRRLLSFRRVLLRGEAAKYAELLVLRMRTRSFAGNWPARSATSPRIGSGSPPCRGWWIAGGGLKSSR